MYALVDCNNFFASCERVFDPSLRDVPLIILSSNDGCVVARSNEAKRLGIKMSTPVFQMRRFLEENHVRSRSCNFELYADLSARVMTLLSAFSAEIVPYSIDEAFLMLEPDSDENLHRLALSIRARLLHCVSLPSGVGMATSKTLAKLGGDYAKKSRDGICIIPRDRTARMKLLQTLPIDDVWGIGRNTAAKLTRLGVRNVAQLADYNPDEARDRFGINVMRTIDELNGRDVIATFDSDSAPHTLTYSRTFGQTITELDELQQSVAYYTVAACEKLRDRHMRAQCVCVYLQRACGGDVYNAAYFDSANIVMPEGENQSMAFLQALRPKVAALFKPGERYRKSGVNFYGLMRDDHVQEDLFTPAQERINPALYAAVDKINRQYGKHTLFHLAEGIDRKWNLRRNFLSPCYTTDWKALPVAK